MFRRLPGSPARRRSAHIVAALISAALAAVLLPGGAAQAVPGGDWGQSHHDGGNTANNPAASVLDTSRVAAGLTRNWELTFPSTGIKPDLPGVLAGDLMYSVENSTSLVARQRSDGAVRWTRAVGTAGVTLPQSVAAADGLVVVTIAGANPAAGVAAFDAVTGAPAWTTPFTFALGTPSRLRVDGGRVFLSIGTSELRGFTLGTGAALWTVTEPDVDLLAASTYGPAGQVFVLCEGRTSICERDGATGALVWSTPLRPQDGRAVPYVEATVAAGRIHVWTPEFFVPGTGTIASDFTAFDVNVGNKLSLSYGHGADRGQIPTNMAAIGDDLVFFTREASEYQPDESDRLYRVDGVSGVAHWVAELGDLNIIGSVAVANDVIYAQCSYPRIDRVSFLCAFAASDGRPLSMTSMRPFPDTLAVAGGQVVSAGYDTDSYVAAYGPAPLSALPGRVEAESSTSPVFTTAAQDVGGGLLVGYLPSGGAVMDYPVEIASAGTYQLSFQVASNYTTMPAPVPDPGLEVQLAGVGVLATVDVPDTGGWQSWQTVNVGVALPAGVHRLRLYVPAGRHGFNLNWFEAVAAQSLTDEAPDAGGGAGAAATQASGTTEASVGTGSGSPALAWAPASARTISAATPVRAARPGLVSTRRGPWVRPQRVVRMDAEQRADHCLDGISPSKLLDQAAIAALCFGA
ncbi:hypothetical protein ACG83_29750 [Frankia sp. R43]|uniref:outer membrane protein assembly factor BamB family protein n=1 Tax=Frankia sp. R43 TaxID=269536 RepID=UPI0006CA0231|nr:PQQ-binding-like beta-propeller repeat protein [Frankia sp. R43]KPM52511.1 hypothetical protein ACG83_29750 [Frankia sp. R43]